MRPIRLSMRAFGPYAGEQELDFTELRDRSFFLIHGPTGSGKTSVLDAMCYALYGDTSGAEREGREMRSHHAAPDVKTEVVFEFALGDRAYRVARSPDWQRPKYRGEGHTTVPADAVIEPLDGTPGRGLPVTGVTAVTRKVEELLGFRSDQFRQVIVLPQGRFRELLAASSSERQDILQTLFRTAFYRDIEAALKERAGGLHQELAEISRRRGDILRETGSAGEEDLGEKVSQLQRRLVLIEAEIERARREVQGTGERLEEAGEIVRATSEVEKAEAALATRRLETGQTVEGWREAGAAMEREEKRDPERRQAEALLVKLGEIGGKRAALDAAEMELARARAELAGLVDELERAELNHSALRERLDQVTELHAAASESARQKDLWEARSRHLAETLAQLDRLAELRSKVEQDSRILDARRADEEEIRSKLETARAESESLLENWSRNQAAILASRLAPGQPCPVCGSPDHPAPAGVAQEAVPSDADLKQAEARVKDLQRRLDQAHREATAAAVTCQGHISAMKTIEDGLGEAAATDEAELRDRAAEAGHRFQEAISAGDRAETLGVEIRSTTEELNRAEKKLKEVREAHRKSELRAGAQAAAVKEKASDIPDEWRDRASFAAALEAAETKAAALTRSLEDARERLARAGDRKARAEQAEAGAGEAHAAAGLRLAEGRDRLVRGLVATGWEDAVARELAGTLTHADHGRFEELAEACARHLERLLGERGSLTQTLAEGDRRLAELAKLAAEFERLESEYQITGRLAEVAAGRNRLGVSLERYVLAALLDDVLGEASRRLRLMSQGRYQLQRILERSDRRVAGGLDLEVYDTYTGTTRSVRTLSGGEGFLASLSLALGLADVVQSRAGGLRLDTIFIDEGFGSLDPESLDLAIRALLDLQQGGRLVGIISHVPELRERIDARLEVIPTRGGSVARFSMG